MLVEFFSFLSQAAIVYAHFQYDQGKEQAY